MVKKSRLIYEKFENININKLDYIENTKVLWMPISVGQDYHEFGKLFECINLIKKNFKKITLIKVIIVDLAQRFQLAINNNTSPSQMIQQAKKKGMIWLQLYEKQFKTRFSDIKIEFNSWEYWLKHELYIEARNEIEVLYNDKNKFFYKYLEEDILEFKRRYYNRNKKKLNDIEIEYCRKCIKEECAILILWSKEIVSLNYSIIFYPKKIPNALLFIKQDFTNFISVSVQFQSKFNIDKVNLFQQRRNSFNFSDKLDFFTTKRPSF